MKNGPLFESTRCSFEVEKTTNEIRIRMDRRAISILTWHRLKSGKEQHGESKVSDDEATLKYFDVAEERKKKKDATR